MTSTAPPGSTDRRRSQGACGRATVLLQTTAPAYRQPVVDQLGLALDGGLTLVCGRVSFEPTVPLEVTHPHLELVENHFLFARQLLWQSGAVGRSVRPATVIAELNPRILSTWVILVVRRLLGRRTILWGHAWSRRGPQARTDIVRQAMRRLADAVVVYTETQAEELGRRMPGATVVAAPNALYPRCRAVAPSGGRAPRHIIFSGRLVEAKKPLLLLEAFIRAAAALPSETELVFLGNGPLKPDLEQRAHAAGVAGRVRLPGAVTRFEELERMYAEALVSVSPGYVGLALVQSLWFGVPAIIARDEPHSPEIEAANGQNAIMIDSNSPEALAAALVAVAADRSTWVARRPTIAADCVERYSVESMVESMARVLE